MSNRLVSELTFKKIDEVPKMIEPDSHSYYDLPLHETAPFFERIIYHYLKTHKVTMSHPYTKSSSLKPVMAKPNLFSTRAPNFLETRTNTKFSRSFRNIKLTIEVP